MEATKKFKLKSPIIVDGVTYDEVPFTIPLERPVTFDGKTYDEIPFDQPTADAYIAGEEATAAGKTNLQMLFAILQFDLGWPTGVLGKLRSGDFQRVVGVMAGFMTEPTADMPAPPAPLSPT